MTTHVDPITLELIKGMMRSARTEMEALIERTAMSPFIREKKDYFTAFCTRDGRMLFGTNLPLGGNLLDAILEQYPAATMRPGDLYWYNDCYGTCGGVSHSPDMVFVAPVFYEAQLVGFAETWGHLWDIGGMMPGSISPAATEIYHEGIIMPPIRIYREGVLNDEVGRIFARNSRFPDLLKGDLRAILASCRLGKQRLEGIFERFGQDTTLAAFEQIIQQSAAAVRVNNCVFGTLALATDGQTNAASSVYVIYMLRSLNRQSGDYTLCIEGLGVGFGARPFSDGPDAIYYVAQKNYPVSTPANRSGLA